MPTTPNLLLPYPAATDPADVPTDMGSLANRIDTAFGVVSATPPASPFDGQLWSLIADATNGVVWTFRYRAASGSANKWEFVGGPPIAQEITSADSSASVTYADMSTVGPQVTVPRAGDYSISFGFRADTSAGSGNACWAAPKLGSATAIDGDAAIFGYSSASTDVRSGSVARTLLARPLAAAVLVKLQYRSHVVSVPATYYNRWLSVEPVRVV